MIDFSFEILALIKKNYGVDISMGYLHTFLKKELNIKFGKLYRKDYRQSPYYKSIFYRRLFHKMKKYKLKYDPETGNIQDLKSYKRVLFF